MRGKKPELTVDGIVWSRNKVLLLKRNHYPFINYWVLPGGHVEYEETLERSVIREIEEETGLNCKIIKLLGVYSEPKRDPRGHTITAVFILKKLRGRLKKDRESKELKFFPLKKLPKKFGFDHKRILADFKKSLKK